MQPQTHSFDIQIAQKYGVIEAIFLHNIAFWIAHNKANKKNYHDGYYRTFNSISAFCELFPYLTSKQIRTTTEKLLKKGVLKSGNYNKIGYDRTKRYTIVCDFVLSRYESHLPNKANGVAQDGKAIPDINKDNKHITKEYNTKEYNTSFGKEDDSFSFSDQNTTTQNTKNIAKEKTNKGKMTKEHTDNMKEKIKEKKERTKTATHNFGVFESAFGMSKDFIETTYKKNRTLPTLFDTLKAIDKLANYYGIEDYDYSYRSVQVIQMTLAKFDYELDYVMDWIDRDFSGMDDWEDLITPDGKPLYVHYDAYI